MNSELDVTLLREDELALKDFPFRPNCHCNTCFLLRRLIEERGRSKAVIEALEMALRHADGCVVSGNGSDPECCGFCFACSVLAKVKSLPAPPEKGKK